MLMEFSVEGERVPMVGAAALLTVRDRLIELYLYRRHDGRESIRWIRTTCRTWVDAILAVNGAN